MAGYRAGMLGMVVALAAAHPALAADDLLPLACKAAVAVEMHQDHRIMTASPEKRDHNGPTVDVSYRRPDDGKRWGITCRAAGRDAADGSRVIDWASIRDDGLRGRWRNDPRYDDHLRFRVEGQSLILIKTFRNGDVTTHTFPLAELRRQPRR